MTTSFIESAYAKLYDNNHLPIPHSSAEPRIDRLRAIAASNYSVSHRLREMLLARIWFDADVLIPAPEETSVFEQVLAEGQRTGTFWMMDDAAIANALIAATDGLAPNATATQVVDLLLQGLVRTSLPVGRESESAAV